MLAGCTTGAVAVTCAQPTDVVKVRFQANGVQPDGVRRYSGTMDAYRTIAREEGVRGLWRGRGGWGQGWDGNRDEEGDRDEMGMGTARLEHPSGMLQEGMRLPSPMPPPSHAGTLPNIARNAIINCGELVTYDLIKDALLRAQLMTGEDGASLGGEYGRVLSLSPRPSIPASAPQTTSPATLWPPSGPASVPQWWHHQWMW